MMQYTYLIVNFLTVIVCFIFSFHPGIQFYMHFGAFIKACVLVGLVFIAWDIWFTKNGVWWFNTDYTIGAAFLGLPIEEWLFFICIPFSCVFTYFTLDKFFNLEWVSNYNKIIAWITLIVCVLVAIIFRERKYPLATGLVTAGSIFYLQFIARAPWIGKASLVYLVLMLGFLPVNGVLTGTGLNAPIVNYNSAEILNVRILTIPIEDSVYGYALYMLNIYFFNRFRRKTVSQNQMSNAAKQGSFSRY